MRRLARSTARLLAAIAGATGTLLQAADPSPRLGPVTSLWLENDLFVRTDQHYTHGTRIAHAGAERDASEPARGLGHIDAWLPSLGNHAVAWRPALSLTQNIYTPEDTSRPDLIPNERPYAGWLCLTGSMLRRGASRSGVPMLDAWSAHVGVVGPASLAEQSQNTVHRIRALPLAQGWENQLRNEPDVGVRYARALRYAAPVRGEWSAEFIPHVGLVGGTAQSFASMGGQWRVGLRLPNDFGWRSIDDVIPASGGRPTSGPITWGLHGFLGVDARVFGHNVLIQGNLFRDSHSVPLQRVVGEVKAGLVYSGRRIDVAYTHQVRTTEFEGQGDVDSFGSVSVALKW
jgi:hypothetical protein